MGAVTPAAETAFTTLESLLALIRLLLMLT